MVEDGLECPHHGVNDAQAVQVKQVRCASGVQGMARVEERDQPMERNCRERLVKSREGGRKVYTWGRKEWAFSLLQSGNYFFDGSL